MLCWNFSSVYLINIDIFIKQPCPFLFYKKQKRLLWRKSFITGYGCYLIYVNQ
ncbi:hypothetical protein HMPREF0201_03182 [Cedecea davisae DSM 4568]|uniref:Uncharacterized protein n=1 Tax=Cedecea davisae DSM 4568 TaxID=566551 RepID=S3IPL6_9ENTR|nr:hypothetical protein HMPREF0201_03182 [Cedecea davisae DSM 4568]